MSWICFALVFTGVAASNENLVIKESNVIHAEEGDSVNITCRFHSPNIDGLYLKRTLVKTMKVLYSTDHGKMLTIDPDYINRTKYFPLQDTAIIMVQQVETNDSDVYICQQIDQDLKETVTSHVILAVRDKPVMKLEKCSSFPWMLPVLIFLALFLVCALGYFILLHMDIKKYCRKRKGREMQTIVYEDMSYSFKRNNRHVPNQN